MGTSISRPNDFDEIISISKGLQEVETEDEVIERLKSLKLSLPLLKGSREKVLSETGTDPATASLPSLDIENINFEQRLGSESMGQFCKWQQQAAICIGNNQSLIAEKTADLEALAEKLIQRAKQSELEAQRCSTYLQEVKSLKDDLKSLKLAALKLDKSCEKLSLQLSQINENNAVGKGPV